MAMATATTTATATATAAPPSRLTVLISGNGTNLQALIDSISTGQLGVPAEIVRVVSNRKDAFGLERARRAGIPTAYHNLVPYKKRYRPHSAAGEEEAGDDGGGLEATAAAAKAAREEYDADLATLVLADSPDLVVCLGFMHVLSRRFLDPVVVKAQVKVINLHPALPGAFAGTKAIERAHAAWLSGQVASTGVMIHEVTAEVDMGRPVLVRELAFVKGVDEDLDALTRRVHELEWAAVVQGTELALRELCEERERAGRRRSLDAQAGGAR